MSNTAVLPSEEDTVRLGVALAKQARRGDVIALSGPLGAGKTTLARGFIRHLTNPREEVVSPTFTLVQTYETDVGTIWHFDLYRLTSANDVVELGFEDALGEGISLIEWPERLGDLLPKNRLDVTLSTENSGRRAAFKGWPDRIATVVQNAHRP